MRSRLHPTDRADFYFVPNLFVDDIFIGSYFPSKAEHDTIPIQSGVGVVGNPLMIVAFPVGFCPGDVEFGRGAFRLRRGVRSSHPPSGANSRHRTTRDAPHGGEDLACA